MAHFLVQVAYTSEAIATLVSHPQDRLQVVSKAVKRLGGKLVGGWLSFGEYDTVVVIQLPDNTAAAAFALALGGGGACKSVMTTPLMTVAEGLEAMKMAGTSSYKPPVA